MESVLEEINGFIDDFEAENGLGKTYFL